MIHPRLGGGFFQRPVLQVAKDLLGKTLVTAHRATRTSGIIVEVEAYSGETDPAAHSFRGPTKRNEAMFKAGGHCYVYFIYGKHFCVNVVTEGEGVGHAVLIRSLQPLEGLERMEKRRDVKDHFNFTSGPGKLCQALGINRSFNEEFFPVSKKIWIEDAGLQVKTSNIASGPRIGISKAVDWAYRFYLSDSLWVSRSQ